MGEGARVNVPSIVVVGSVLTGLVVAVAGMAVGRGKTAGGTGGGGIRGAVDVGAITIGVGEAPLHPLRRHIAKVITTIPHFIKT